MIETPTRPFTGRHMLFIMLSFFATILAANMTLVYSANHSWTGLVVKNSYVASQEFNATTEKLERQAKGVQASLAYQQGVLVLRLTDASGNPLLATDVKVKLGRPSHEGEDRVIALAAIGEGQFKAAHHLAKGQWSGEATATITGHPDWQRPMHLFVKD